MLTKTFIVPGGHVQGQIQRWRRTTIKNSVKLSTTYANVWRHAFRPMVDILSILCELGSRA